MMQGSDRPRHSQSVAIVLTVLVGAIATAVAYLGTRESTSAPVSLPVAGADTLLPIQTIVLPHDEPELPSGPHQRTFVASCTICHSTRLVMTQPPFSHEQWAEVVHKMVKTYGAPITTEAEGQIVDYLVAVRSQ
jgi:hypothetical protein